MKYDFTAIEKKWQEKWEQEKPYAAVTGDKKPKFYGLIEFPYPSGQGLHVGHPRSYTALDIVARVHPDVILMDAVMPVLLACRGVSFTCKFTPMRRTISLVGLVTTRGSAHFAVLLPRQKSSVACGPADGSPPTPSRPFALGGSRPCVRGCAVDALPCAPRRGHRSPTAAHGATHRCAGRVRDPCLWKEPTWPSTI